MSHSVHQKYNLHNWLTFLSERAPPAVFLLLAAGPCLTGLRFVQGYVDWEKFLWSLVSQLVLLLVIRVMDDVKDYEKDKIVHPDRPLPRGLVQYGEVVNVISFSLAAMYVLAVLFVLRFSWTIGIIYALQVTYAVLMYNEFGIGEWFEEWVFLYAFSHQVSIYFGSWFICALAGANWYGTVSFLLGSVAFSGFFTYEVCRKLDPTLPKLKGTYLVVYGKWLTFLITCFTVSVGVISSYILDMHRLLWPLEAVMILSLVILFSIPVTGPKPRAHKPVEALSVVYLLVHMWSGFIASFW